MSVQNLITARSNLENLLAEITLNPKPTYTVKGRTIDWASYMSNVREQIDALSKTINARQPWIVHTRQTL